MLRRLRDAIKGLVDRLVDGYERRNPEALLQLAIEDFGAQMASLQRDLAVLAGRCSTVESEVTTGELELERLAAKIAADLEAGNAGAAGEAALDQEARAQELEEKRTRLAAAKESYQKTLARVPELRAEFKLRTEELQRRIQQAKLEEALASAQGASTELSVQVGEVAETLKRVDEVLKEKAAAAEGALRAAHDLAQPPAAAAPGDEAVRAERKARGAEALARFAAARGLALPGAPPRPPSSAGPASAAKPGAEASATADSRPAGPGPEKTIGPVS
ncbi:MAG: hypothetical protein HYZ53_18860 [Planctomycetes bacterium]|nr:hypothetical protein [Planctomycetota bacterium]